MHKARKRLEAVFVSVCTPLVAILFSASAQLVSSSLLSCHGGGGGGSEDTQRESHRNKQKQVWALSEGV
jgi:hypothetical protein